MLRAVGLEVIGALVIGCKFTNYFINFGGQVRNGMILALIKF